ncbi:MAG TPA: NADH-quinone oxidoreductase subunit J, partial [Candidatus Omnitrophota bacterium]|nr:NADH-quinone oxidoreductase subunit J [Candidatus Omnitrophota bacterium]
MEILTIGAKFGVYIVMALVLVFALGVVTLRNLFHSALCLAAVLVGTATVYLALRADFVAAIQILVYVGAVMTLIIFAIMLTEHLGEKTIRQTNRQSPAAILGLLGFIFMIGLVILRTPWPVTKRALATGTSQAVLDYTAAYANDRVAFGEPISHKQAVAFMIAILTESTRLIWP